MNVYFAGGEDVEFTYTGTVINQTNYGNAAYCREQIEVPSGSTAWPMTNSISNPASFGNQASFWVHAQVFPYNSNATTASNIMLALADSAGVGRLMVRGTGTAGQLKITTRNAAGTFVDLVTSAANVWTNPVAPLTVAIDLFVNYSTSGQATLYVNGVSVADTLTGVNVTTDSATSLSYVYFGAAGASDYIWSEMIVADSDTRPAHLWLMNSNTAGNAQTWTGTATSVNKPVINDTTYISAASAGLIEEFKTGGIAFPSGTWAVAAVVMSSRALGGSAGGPTRVEYVTRVGSTDYVGGTWTPPVGSFGNNSNYIQATNPGTGSAWLPSDLTAATFNYGIESVA
jgi:hypothetical protein